MAGAGLESWSRRPLAPRLKKAAIVGKRDFELADSDVAFGKHGSGDVARH